MVKRMRIIRRDRKLFYAVREQALRTNSVKHDTDKLDVFSLCRLCKEK